MNIARVEGRKVGGGRTVSLRSGPAELGLGPNPSDFLEQPGLIFLSQRQSGKGTPRPGLRNTKDVFTAMLAYRSTINHKESINSIT